MLALLFLRPGRVRVAYMDEARLGLHGQEGRRLSLRGVRPVSPRQREYKWGYLWAAACPADGNAVTMESTHVCALAFNQFLKEVSQHWQKELVLLVLDGAGYHRARKVERPRNVMFLFLPPYSPELNPVERLWQEVRRAMKGLVYKTLEEAMAAALRKLAEFQGEKLASLCDGFNLLGPLALTG